jgi:hypothetical protein
MTEPNVKVLSSNAFYHYCCVHCPVNFLSCLTTVCYYSLSWILNDYTFELYMVFLWLPYVSIMSSVS